MARDASFVRGERPDSVAGRDLAAQIGQIALLEIAPRLGLDERFAKFVPQFLLLWSSRNFAKFELAGQLRTYFVARAHDLPLETSISAWNQQNGTDTFNVVCVRGGVVAFSLPGPAFYGGSGGDSIEIVPFEAILRISGDSGAR